MPLKYNVEIPDPTVCFYCKTEGLTESDYFCTNCGFPQHGTLREQKGFLCDMDNREIQMGQQKLTLGFARYILFCIAVVNFVVAIFWLKYASSNFKFISELIMSVVYMFLGIWAIKKPFPAILTGLIIYVVMIVFNGILIPASLFSGIIMKIIFIATFCYGVADAKRYEKNRREQDTIKWKKEDQ